ncbi:uncharacterized protein LOC132903943 [Amyelois transitella]|uniref:uncharacterized protein LOC132903943 n=1 Tax=Amyelois transitella TaxID=680683 RepID=UPI00298F9251|nr:uncharacterized protein LOC132903943 [Amyelois transitella]XP_060809564.1 uncharacterized protein LOC132903943 [Amyelois transitella]
MLWLRVAAIWTMVTAADAINRPVYKVVLTQKGYAQFLQYDLETPPLIEFTFCTWIRLYNIEREQTIFTYIVNSNRNMVRLWIDPGGRNVQLAINGWLATTSPIEMIRDVWKHVCVSYQSDFGAWALYVDARLVTCGASQALNGFILPPGGSVSIGYGTTDDGLPSGIEGELFGVNMILISTIERNYTMKQNPMFKQKHFRKNKLKENRRETNKYIVLNELKETRIHNSFEDNPRNSNKSYFRTPHESTETSNERDILEFAIPGRSKTSTSDPNNIPFWSLVHNNPEDNRLQKNRDNFKAEARDLPILSEFETPPPLSPGNLNNNFKGSLDNYKQEEKSKNLLAMKLDNANNMQKGNEISEIETPPPLENDKKVYGQWVSSKFAASVLNHLRNLRFNKKDIQPLPTIPLHKMSDAFPYASEYKLTKLRPPSEFERRNLGENKFYPALFGKRRPQFNVQILEDDIREKILKSHSRLKPKNINVINKGESKLNHERFNRQALYTSQQSSSSESIEIENTPRPFRTNKYLQSPSSEEKKRKSLSKKLKLKNNLTVLPFLKSLEYLIEDSDKTESKTNKIFRNDMYTRSLSSGNKWHNTKSYSNDYTPRQIDAEQNIEHRDIEHKLADSNNNNKHPAVKLKYKHKNRDDNTERPITNGRNLAKTVSSLADFSIAQSRNPESVSIQKFIYDSSEDYKNKDKGSTNDISDVNERFKVNNFNKHVKIGNALNEQHVIGKNEVQKKRSFEGGDASVPDINRYRSDIDKEYSNVPPSLSPKVCKNVELYDRVLYIQPDESVDLTHFMSPVKLKNPAIEFIQQNYKLCSLDGSFFENDPLLYLDWGNTPVRLFGGAYLQTTTDLCGFFKK